ncbi:hypothetical protein FBEOM_3196 [Fusarium beomiforme]|uniref:Uncharacterized protein n=1 Tax=Fusarium beomiforme TaxID=44412 RepID=A0A9P5DZE8_9HYPO|nr:hypothetical protein FBEOM_3196 [Fusarium beomiforme]
MSSSRAAETESQIQEDIRNIEIKKVARHIQHLAYYFSSVPPFRWIALTEEDIRLAQEVNLIKNITMHSSAADCPFPREWVEDDAVDGPLAIALRDWREQVNEMKQKDEPTEEDSQAKTTDIMTDVHIKADDRTVLAQPFGREREAYLRRKIKGLEERAKQAEAGRKCLLQNYRDLLQQKEHLEGTKRSLLQAVYDSDGSIHAKHVKAKVELYSKICEKDHVIEAEKRRHRALTALYKEQKIQNETLVAKNEDLEKSNEKLIAISKDLEKSMATVQSINEALVTKNKALEKSSAVLVVEHKRLETFNKDLVEQKKALKESLGTTIDSSKIIDQVLTAKVKDLEIRNEDLLDRNTDLEKKNKAQAEMIKDLEARLTVVIDVESCDQGSKKTTTMKIDV